MKRSGELSPCTRIFCGRKRWNRFTKTFRHCLKISPDCCLIRILLGRRSNGSLRNNFLDKFFGKTSGTLILLPGKVKSEQKHYTGKSENWICEKSKFSSKLSWA